MTSTLKTYSAFIVALYGTVLILFSPSGVTAKEHISIKNSQSLKLDFRDHFEIFTDSGAIFTPKNIVEAPFKVLDKNRLNFGINKFNNWVKFTVENQTGENVLLKIDNVQLGELSLFVLRDHQLVLLEKTGQKMAFDKREYKSGKYVFSLPVKEGQSRTFYVRVKGFHQLNLPLTIGSDRQIAKNLLFENLFFGVYLGIMGAMLLYNLFIYFSVKMPGYIFYVLYILSVALVQSSLQGINFQFLFPNSPQTESISLFILNPLTALFSVLFFWEFVKVRKYSKVIYYALSGCLMLYGTQVIMALLGYYHTAYKMMNFFAFILAFTLLFSALYTVIKGSRQGRFFLGAWSFFLLSVIIFVLTDEGILIYNLFTKSILQLGSAAAALLLAFGLADNINIIRRQNEHNRLKALEAAQENERLIRNKKIELEVMVDERTQDLTLSNEELSHTLQELRETQAQLVSQEKMASLGQLTAGIAHEINNPINFVTSNVKPIRRDIDDVFEILDDFLKIENSEDYKTKIKAIQDKIERYELTYIRDEIYQLLEGIAEGAKRTAEIVRGLKVFSRAEEQDVKSVDLLEGLESTLTLLNNTTKNAVQIERDFENIPRVECYAGKINQVFMNLLSNAVFAVKQKHGEGNGGMVKVAAKNAGEYVEFRIEDNGSGISQDKIKDIFNPFFTTKDPGEGTGLGLSISQSIIAKHNGEIEVWSEPDQGTAFTVKIPIKMQSDEFQKLS